MLMKLQSPACARDCSVMGSTKRSLEAAVVLALELRPDVDIRISFGIAGFVFFCFAFYDIYKMMEPNSALRTVGGFD